MIANVRAMVNRGLARAGNARTAPAVAAAMSRRARTLRTLVTTLSGCAVVLVARASLADHYRVPSGSMEPTVVVGDQICVNKAAYGLRVPESETYLAQGADPARGDVVVLASPTDGEVLLKRVVAVPGDVVAVVDGRVAIDGAFVPVVELDGGATVEQLGEHPHALGTSWGGGPDFGPVRVPADGYLVLGDNRGNSRDGRFFGWVARGAILGRAVAVCLHDGRPAWQPL
ncbi:MAG TPA: signal peptidase I [Polyangiaceae bacterium]|jgi:signal peptidase I